jgi:multidrug efflux pump subunit AcrA (membrane-fusion protein)
VWVQVNVPADEAIRVGRTAPASFRMAGDDRDRMTRRLVSVGSIIDSTSRTVPVIYETPNPDGALKIGANARVAVRTGRAESGVVIPASALLDEDGRPVAYVQTEGEAFEKRELELGGADSSRTLVRAGIRPGERVVTGAAYQVRLASLSTSVPVHGHEH